MSSQSQPTTPVRVPKAATTYSPATQDPDLRSQINSMLFRDGHVEKIQQTLHHALYAHPSNWPARVSSRALELLRSGEATTFPKLMERVLADIRRDTEEARLCSTSQSITGAAGTGSATPTSSGTATSGVGPGKANGVRSDKGKEKGAVNGVGAGVERGAAEGKVSLALPKAVVEEGIRVTRECLELVCEIEE